MVNRFNTKISRGDTVSYHTSRGEIRCGIVLKFYRMAGYGWRIHTSAGDCGIDDVIVCRGK